MYFRSYALKSTTSITPIIIFVFLSRVLNTLCLMDKMTKI